ncbi:MAG: RNA 2',3'-cyclic phosphodiesterase [Actinobacteria bacterium]|nr:RNA 2',3'-cyclic phosphodiesterase [Actinomycetota bacterium]
MARLFLAVWPPDDVVAELRMLPRKDQRGVRFVRPENWHITLRFLGDSDPSDVIEAMDGVVFAPAVARLGPAVDVLDERVLVVPVQGVDDIAREVRARTRHIGEPAPKRFIGHLTLARVKPREQMPRALGARVDATFDVDEVALVQSRLHPDGARYETTETWPVG